MADIFISYSSHDRLQALSLAEELRALGTSVWIDQVIDGAAQWSSEIAQALDECKALILLVSKSSLASKNCIKEVTIAAESDKFILPVDLEDIKFPREFKYHLAGIQRVAYSNREGILRSLKKIGLGIGSTDIQSLTGGLRVRPTISLKPDAIRIAVLPFDDLSPKNDNAWFADGMMDELIGTLSQVQKLRVASRSEVLYYKKHRPKAKKIADDLKVRYLIEGSVRKAGEKIRISASLSDMAFGEQLWMNNYDGTFDDVFNFQETVSKKIAEALELKLTPQEEKVIQEQPTQNTEAYELYLRGLEFHRLLTRDGYEKALKLYEAAVALDPKYVDAYLAIANVSCAYYRECSRDLKWLNRAEMNLSKAESIQGETAKTLWIRGEMEWQKGNFEIAEITLEKSVELDPKFHGSFNILGNVYLKTGKLDKAVNAFQKVVQLIPSSSNYFNLLVSLSDDDNDPKIRSIALEALPLFERELRQNPENMQMRVSYAYTLFWANKSIESFSEAEKLTLSEDLDGLSLFNLANLFLKLGNPKRKIELFRKSIQKGFREIEAFREDHFFEEPVYREELLKIISELEYMIKEEQSGS